MEERDRSAGLVNEAELEELLVDCPTLFHMAESGSWASIREHGLLSTSALLDALEITGEDRYRLEGQHRPESVAVNHPKFGRAVIRDQKPMDDAGLRRCLQDGLTVEEWYRLLNGRVFFWLTEARLLRLLGAKAYRELEHDVLEIDSRSLVREYRGSITLCPINSGCTKPMAAPRGKDTFRRIDEYPYGHWKGRRPRGERVVELAVIGAVPNVSRHVRRVTAMKGTERLRVLWEQ